MAARRKGIPSRPTPLNTKHRHSRRGHGDSGSRRTVAGRAVDAWWIGKLFATRVIPVASRLRRYRFFVVFHVVEFEFFPLFVWNRFTFSTAEITTEETAAAEVAASYDAAEHEQRLCKETHARTISIASSKTRYQTTDYTILLSFYCMYKTELGHDKTHVSNVKLNVIFRFGSRRRWHRPPFWHGYRVLIKSVFLLLPYKHLIFSKTLTITCKLTFTLINNSVI